MGELKEVVDSLQTNLDISETNFRAKETELSSFVKELELLKNNLQNAVVDNEMYKQKSESMRKEVKRLKEENVVLLETLEEEEQQRQLMRRDNKAVVVPMVESSKSPTGVDELR